MKVCLQRATARVAQDQLTRVVSPFAPLELVHIVPQVFDYVVTNKRYIQKKKCGILVHPRKIAKTIPSVVVGNIVSSDMLSDVVDNIHDKNIHDLAHAIVVFVKYALMAL